MPNVVTMQIWFDAWNADVRRSIEEYHRREAELAAFQELRASAEIPAYCATRNHPLSEATVSWRNGSWRCNECRNEWQRSRYRDLHPVRKRAAPKHKVRGQRRLDAARKYKEGALIRELAAEYGVSRPTMIRALRLAGVPIRGRHESARMAQPKGYLHLTAMQRAELVARYIEGESSSDLALAFGVSPMTALRTLRTAGVPRRTKSESLKLSYANRRTNKRERA